MATVYAMYYTGKAGSGHAVFVMSNGVIAGADVAGGVLDGTYRDAGKETYEVSATLTVPAGTWLVTGKVADQQPFTQEISACLPTNLGGGSPVTMQTPTGPVNVVFKRLRDIP